MKSTLLALALASALPVPALGADKDTPLFFAVGSSYTLRLADNARVLPGFVSGRPVKVIAAAQDGWYRIEYFSMPANYAPKTEPPQLVKRQTWLNLAYVVSVDEAPENPEGKPK